MVRRVCLVSGGTGGHLMPALVLARAIRERGHEPLLVTEGREVERAMVARELPDVESRPLPGQPIGPASARARSRLALPMWLARTTLAARTMLREERVDCVVSTGGRPSVPVGLAARSLGMPLFLLEQNAVTGRANRWLLPFAKRIYHGLPMGRIPPRGLLTGTPLRADLGRISRQEARRKLGLPANEQVVLVMGGSQGARAINETVPAVLARVSQRPVVIHLAGAGQDEAVRQRYQKHSDAGDRDTGNRDTETTQERAFCEVRVLPGAGDMGLLYAAADLVICRGGGTTVAELAAVGRPAVIVPYPHHRDRQQVLNAQVLAEAEAAVIVEERELSLAWLAGIVETLLADPARLAAMGQAARRICPGGAAATILSDLERVNGWSGAANPPHPAAGGAAIDAHGVVAPVRGAGG